MENFCRATAHVFGAVALSWVGAVAAPAPEDASETQRQLRQLQQQNEVLQQQMRKQQELIEELNRKFSRLQAVDEKHETEADSIATKAKEEAETPAGSPAGFSLGKVHLGGEGAVGLFHSQAHGQFPNTEFRVDEAKLFLEAPIWGEVYFFSELDVYTREAGGPRVRAGELYLDAENISRLWNQDGQLNLRAGRFDIPFGEEYLARDAIDNPLVSHSLIDLWGVDEGVELYGKIGRLQYVVAVQNGGHDGQRDFNGDKAVVARIGTDPARWLHLSVSAMRTGALDVEDDGLSELWLGPGLVYSLGSPNTTLFHANLLEGDVHLTFPRTTVKAAGGVLQYDDNDPSRNNRREVYYYYVEGVQKLFGGLYAAARWSQVFAARGFPIAGNGNVDTYAFGADLTEDLWLLSLGLGYRWSPQLVLKAEYSFEQGTLTNGARRRRENLFALTAAFAF